MTRNNADFQEGHAPLQFSVTPNAGVETTNRGYTKTPYHHLKATFEDGSPAGFLKWKADGDANNSGEIMEVYTHPSFRRQGVATSMIKHAHEQATSMGITKPGYSGKHTKEGDELAKSFGFTKGINKRAKWSR